MAAQVEGIKFLNRNLPSFAVEEARRIAREQFGLEGELELLVSERDQNFRITSPGGGDGYVLKLANVDEDPGVVDLQTAALRHIERHDPSLPVPRVIPSRDGEPSTMVRAREGTQHIARVLTYLPGMLLEEAENTPELRRNLGTLMGRADLALRGFFHPHARHPLLWDTMRCPELRVHTRHVGDAEARRNVESVLDHMDAVVLAQLAGCRNQIIHNDAHGNNVLVDPDRTDRGVGLLDFGDMLYGPLVVEVANAADSVAAHAEDSVRALAEVAAGFDRVLPLEELELDLLYDAYLARLAITATIIAWRKAVTPGQPAYLPEYEAPCWAAIDRMMSRGRRAVRSQLREVCRFPPHCPSPPAPSPPDDVGELLARRRRVLGRSLYLFYDPPLHVERGLGPWLYGADGRPYLDAYNNVPVVGHSHPQVVRALSRQAAALNTNTRYLYRSVLDYAERLGAVLPGELSACLFVNSGSEANDVAWQMAKLLTGRGGALVMEHAYHGITAATAELSPYDTTKPLAPHVRTLIAPDPYRGPYRHGDPDLAARYAADADRALAELAEQGHEVAAFMVDTSFCSNGIPEVPPGYLAAVCAKVKAAGGLVIADEVQAGFGRPGSHFWGHTAHGVVPDIVTLGKPVANGYPLGVVVTTLDALDEFGRATGLFSTFGGNPVACAAGLAVLDVIEEEGLLPRAKATGAHLLEGIRGLMSGHRIVGDVRGQGLLVGVELVRDRKTRAPAGAETKQLLNILRDNGVLIGREGPHGNVLKIRPSLTFGPEHADRLVAALERSLAALVIPTRTSAKPPT